MKNEPTLGKKNKGFDELSAFAAEMKAMSDAHNAGDIDAVMPEEKFEGIYRTMAKGVNDSVGLHVKNVLKILNIVGAYAEGNLEPVLEKLPGKQVVANEKLDLLRNNLLGVISEMTRMAEAQKAGDIDAFVSEDKFPGAYKQIAAGVNESVRFIVNYVLKILNILGAYADGDLNPVLEKLPGKQVVANEMLDKLRNNLRTLIAEVNLLSMASAEGKLATRADASKHQGDYRKIVQGINEMLDAVVGPLTVSAKYVDQISKGDIPAKITDTYKGDFNEIKNNLNACIDAVNALVAEAGMLVKASGEGKLATRADATKHQGDYRKLVEGINEMLDAILLPIGEGNRILAQVSSGKIDELIAQTYKGDHEKMKLAVNNVASVVQGLQKELGRLTEASREGLLSERGKPDQFQGAYAGIVKGVNEMLDAILLPIGEGNRILALISNGKIDELIAQTYKGDHEKMKQAINNVAVALQGMAGDVNALAKASMEGKLSTRADAAKHQGEFRKIVQGVNEILDLVIAPVQEAGGVLQKVAGGDLTAHVQGNYQGDHARIKDDINIMADKLSESMGQISHNAQTLASSSEELSAVSAQMSSNAEETSSQANVVSAASEQVSKNIQTVATATEEMSASIKEIAKSATEAAKIATAAVRTAESTNATVGKLGESSAEIGQVIKVITSIAQQTNLLASERHHRGGTRRRSRQRLCGGCQRGEGTGQGDRQGHRGYQPEDRGDPGRYQGSRGGYRSDYHHHQPTERHLQHDCQRGGGTNRHHQRDFSQCG